MKDIVLQIRITKEQLEIYRLASSGVKITQWARHILDAAALHCLQYPKPISKVYGSPAVPSVEVVIDELLTVSPEAHDKMTYGNEMIPSPKKSVKTRIASKHDKPFVCRLKDI